MTKQQKKRVGPTHRVRKCDPPPWPNDWLEWTAIAIALTAIGAGALFMYYLSETV